jgi:hypothetical protein
LRLNGGTKNNSGDPRVNDRCEKSLYGLVQSSWKLAEAIRDRPAV